MATPDLGDIKIFGLGLQKTGLTSLLRLLQKCGLNARGTNLKIRRQFARRGDYQGVLDYYDSAQMFCDWPTPLMYKAAFAKYGPRARFILTVRKDADTWFDSLKRHNRYAHPILNKHRWVFGRYYPHGFDAEHKAYYERHNREVQEFFEARGASDQLLVIRVDDPESIGKLAAFLGIQIPFETFPRENVSAGNRRDIGSIFKWNYNKLALPLYERVAPRLSRGPVRQLVPIEVEVDSNGVLRPAVKR
ncbi:MAG: hypothetical protein H6876_04720 [Hyphomicrobiaceae bacterium]|nr:hypothetical protein [Hyphomicrobiaceae bacterium]MCC0007411.1 hypothetical protein [Hyphomicrobiaceae bacterium]